MKKLGHSLKVNILFAVITASLLSALILVNAIALRLSERYPLQIDLTANALYELGDETKDMLAALSAPVEIYVLSDEGGFGGSNYLSQAKRVMDWYPRYSGNVSLRYVDYAVDPAFAANYPDLSLSQGDIIVKSGGRVRHIIAANLFHYTYQQDGSLAVSASRAEEALSSAIINVTSGETVKIAVLSGNGVADASLFTALLADNNYQLESVNLTSGELGNYDIALLFAPTIDLSEDVVRKLEAFLYNGGSYGKTLFYAAVAAQGSLPNLDLFLAEWGVAFENGAVFETSAERTYQYQPYYPTAVYAEGQYTDMLRDASMPFLMPLSRPMELLFTARDGYYVETLLSFSESSGVRPADAGESFSADSAERRGPMPAFALSTYNAEGRGGEPLQSRIIVSASAGIFDTVALQNTSVTNAEYLLNLLSDLTNREGAILVQPKSLAGNTLGITSAEASALGVILAGVIPGLILLAGVAVWLWRRYK